MALKQNSAEGQANSTVLTTANSGGGSGDAFGVVSSGNITFSSSQAAHGSLSYRFVASAGTAIYAGLQAASPSGPGAARMYLYLTAYPAANIDSMLQLRATTGRAAVLGINTAGRLLVYNSAGSVIATSTNPLTLNTWIRCEVLAIPGADTATGTISAAYYTGDTTSATWTYSASNVNAGTNNVNEGRFGKVNTTGDINAYFDDLAFNDGATAFLGPAVSNAQPVADAGADQVVTTGDTVTLTGSGADSDGTIASYTWTQLSGASVTLSGSGATRTFTAPGVADTLVFSLVVTDNGGLSSDADTVTVTVGLPPGSRVLLANTAEGGSNGTAITSVGSQAGGSGDAFDTVSIGTGGSLTYSTEQAIVGTKSYKMVQGTGSIIVGWTTSLAGSAPINDFVFQGYIYLTATPTAQTPLYKGYADTLYTATEAAWAVTINSSRQIVVQNATSNAYTLATPLALNTWYRIEGEFIAGTSSQVKVSEGLSTTVYTYGSSASFTSKATVAVRQGIGTSSSGLGTVYFDDFTAASGPGFLTDTVYANQLPAANAGGDKSNIEPWTTVTLAGTDSDGDGTVVSRTWRQVSGTPIVTLSGTGTSRTYQAPATISGTVLTFGYQVTDNGGGVSAESTVDHTILPVTERAVIGGVEVPLRIDHVSTG